MSEGQVTVRLLTLALIFAVIGWARSAHVRSEDAIAGIVLVLLGLSALNVLWGEW